MAESPNTNGYSFSWTQPYSVPSHNPFYGMSSGEIYNQLTLEEEMAKIEMVDRWVDAMLTYPDADAIMNKIRQQGDSNV